MKIHELRRINKFYFGYPELAGALGIKPASARVAAGRYVKQGLLVRIKRNLYMLRDVWENAGLEEKFRIANLGQVPSYVSLTTALSYYHITTQMQRDFFESIAVRRTAAIRIDNAEFNYTRIAPDLYFGFKKENGFFIASPEKAFLDALYLMSYGRYALDLAAVDAARLDLGRLAAMSASFPEKTRSLLKENGYLRPA